MLKTMFWERVSKKCEIQCLCLQISSHGDLRLNPVTIERSLAYGPLIPSSNAYADHMMASYRVSLLAVAFSRRMAKSVTFTNDVCTVL